MRVLWLTWKDRTHPLTGGAEVVNEELAKRLVADGHEVTFIVGGYKGATAEETSPHGFRIIRVGNRLTVYWKTYRYYKRHMRGWADLVIDEINTIPYFAKFYARERNLLFVHQLARKVWFYEMPFPLSLIGYVIEPFYLFILCNKKVITISQSTKRDLIRHGFKPENISVISEGIELEPVRDLDTIEKYGQPTLLSLGSLRPMKRILDQVKAFEIAKQSIPELQLKVAGDYTGTYGAKVLKYIKSSMHTDDIEVLGKVSQDKKIELMQKSHVLMVTSIKEGWGLVVTEANSQGTPAVVYDVDGLRDSVRNKVTGQIVQSSPKALSEGISSLVSHKVRYNTFRKNAYAYSKSITFTQSYDDFIKAIGVSGE